jgi:beta-glucosidase
MATEAMTRAVAAPFAMIGAVWVLAGGAAAQAMPEYRNPEAPVERRVADLLGRMTLEEKVGQMLSLWQGKNAITATDGVFDGANAGRWFRVGVGRIERPAEGHTARTQAEFTNAIQRWVRDSTRLGIPVLFHDEALHGIQGAEATSFPQAIALASTWNPELVERIQSTIAGEVRSRGTHQVLSPVIDIALDPRWGRYEETFGEDAYLTSRMGLAAVRGLQGSGERIAADHVIATLKHMTGHGQPEGGINVGPAPLGERTLRDFFLYPFEVAVRDGGVRAIMPSYNEIDGMPSHANTWMLRDVLRGEWGFDGVIVSDWFAIEQMAEIHRVAVDAADAARRALEATVDIELPDVVAYETLVEQVESGAVSMEQVDAAATRLLRAKFDLGLFENPYVDPAHADRVSGAERNRALALEAARQAITLLKNESETLPLDPAGLSGVAVIGPHAGEVMLGGYSGTPRYSVSILEGIRARLGQGADVEYAEGVRITEDSVFTDDPQPHMGGTRSQTRWSADRVVFTDSASNAARIAEAVALARRSQIAIVVAGDNEQTAREAYAENHLGDRSSIGLPGQQAQLIEALLETGTPVVLLLINGRPASIPALVERVPAILEGWYLGQETGTAVAEVLFGDVNPSGRLPVTIARHVGQLPVFYNRKPSAGRGYLGDTTEPLFPFGFGLSYTTFAYSNVRLSEKSIGIDGRTVVSVDVRNTGSRAGDEVVQLYIRDVVSSATRPLKQLRGFDRVAVGPGEVRTVTFEIGPEHLSFHGADMTRTVEPGSFEIMVGGSSVDLISTTLEVRAPVGDR